MPSALFTVPRSAPKTVLVAVGEDTGSRPDQFGIDDATIDVLDRDRELGPCRLIGLGLWVDLRAVGILGRITSSDRQRFEG